MGTLLSILGNSVVGSLIGSLFAWLNKREEIKQEAAKYAHEEKLLGLQNEQQLRLADKGMQATRVAGDVAVEAKEADAFVEAQRGAFGVSGIKWIDGALRLVRPIITVYLLALATYVAYVVAAKVGGVEALAPAVLLALFADIIAQIFFLTNLCVSFWFGARGGARPRGEGKRGGGKPDGR